MLKIAVLSDTHLGFGIGTERENDCYENLEQATKLALKEGAQLILMCGDIFHDKIPRQEVLGKAIEIFTRVNRSMNSAPKLLKRVKLGNTEVFKELVIPPVIAIWGTHERRHIGSTNPVQILEKAGLMACLHTESILVECNSDKIGIHGMSGVPEQYAKDTMKAWSPKPFEDCFNILMLHQNIKEAMPPVDYALDFGDFPKDFISLCGHIHSTSRHKHPVSKNPIIVVGSTVTTQLQKIESETPKGFYIFEFGRENYNYKFVTIKTRPFFYETLDVAGKRPAEILADVEEKILSILKNNPVPENVKPVIRLKLDGKLAQGFRTEDFNFSRILAGFEQKVILSLDKSKLEAIDSQQHSNLLEDLRDRKLSIDEIGIKILEKNLGINISAEKLGTIFNLLSEDEIEQAELAIEGNLNPQIQGMENTPRIFHKYEAKPEEIKYAEPVVELMQARQTAVAPEIETKKEAMSEAKIVAPQQKQEVQQRQATAPPETVYLAESGLSLLAGSSRQQARSVVQQQQQPRSAPQPPVQRPQTQMIGAETNGLAESGLSKNAGQGVARSSEFFNSQDSQSSEFGLSMLASSNKKPNNISRTIEKSSRFATADTKPAPRISDLVEQKVRQEKEKEVLTQGGKISGGAVESGLSMLASSDKKAPPSIRLKEGQNLKTISVVKGAVARPPLRIAERPAERSAAAQPAQRQPAAIAPNTAKPRVSQGKEKFDIQKWLNKEF